VFDNLAFVIDRLSLISQRLYRAHTRRPQSWIEAAQYPGDHRHYDRLHEQLRFVG
jgi:hypothetical protein